MCMCIIQTKNVRVRHAHAKQKGDMYERHEYGPNKNQSLGHVVMPNLDFAIFEFRCGPKTTMSRNRRCESQRRRERERTRQAERTMRKVCREANYRKPTSNHGPCICISARMQNCASNTIARLPLISAYHVHSSWFRRNNTRICNPETRWYGINWACVTLVFAFIVQSSCIFQFLYSHAFMIGCDGGDSSPTNDLHFNRHPFELLSWLRCPEIPEYHAKATNEDNKQNPKSKHFCFQS